MQFRACFLNGEMPSDRRLGRIAFSLQSGDFLHQRGFISDPARQALALKYTELQFGHVQPTAMLGRVMKLQAFENASRLFGREGLIQRGWPMGVEITQHHPDQLGLRVNLITQPLHLSGEILHGATVGHRHMPPTASGFKLHKQIARAVALVLIVVAFHLPRRGRQRGLRLGPQLLRAFIEADYRALRIIRFGVQIQHIFHGRDKLGAYFGNAPFLLLPRFEFVFFSNWRIASCEMESANSKSTTRPASKRKVHRAWPLGAALQTVAITSASALPSNLCSRPGRGFSLSAPSNPSSTNRLRVRSTVARPVCKAWATCSSCRPSSALSRMCARLTFRAAGFPRRINWSNWSRSSGLRSTTYLMAGMAGTSFRNRSKQCPTIPAHGLSIKTKLTDY